MIRSVLDPLLGPSDDPSLTFAQLDQIPRKHLPFYLHLEKLLSR